MKIDRSLLIDAVSPTGRAIPAAMVEPPAGNWAGLHRRGVETLEQAAATSARRHASPAADGLPVQRLRPPLPAADAAASGETPARHGRQDLRFYR